MRADAAEAERRRLVDQRLRVGNEIIGDNERLGLIAEIFDLNLRAHGPF